MSIARFEKRVFAYLIDTIFAILISIPLTLLICYATNWSMPWYFGLLICQLFAWFIYALFSSCAVHWSNGYSIGGAIFGIKSVHRDGKRISVADAVVKGVCIGIWPFVLANAVYMLIVHTEITVFDRMTDTIVIDSRNIE